jgi:hypothetical protein
MYASKERGLPEIVLDCESSNQCPRQAGFRGLYEYKLINYRLSSRLPRQQRIFLIILVKELPLCRDVLCHREDCQAGFRGLSEYRRINYGLSPRLQRQKRIFLILPFKELPLCRDLLCHREDCDMGPQCLC